MTQDFEKNHIYGHPFPSSLYCGKGKESPPPTMYTFFRMWISLEGPKFPFALETVVVHCSPTHDETHTMLLEREFQELDPMASNIQKRVIHFHVWFVGILRGEPSAGGDPTCLNLCILEDASLRYIIRVA